MKRLPILLIYSRIPAGLAVMGLAVAQPSHFRVFIIALIIYGLVSDIADGIIARKMGISTETIRRLDSSVDQVFWILVILSAIWLVPNFFKTHWIWITILAALEAAAYLLSYARFGKEVATHAIASKIWTLSLFAMLIQLFAVGNAGWVYWLCIITGVISRCEIIAILILLKHWTNDVPSLYHAIQIRQGKTIRRSKWFNG